VLARQKLHLTVHHAQGRPVVQRPRLAPEDAAAFGRGAPR